MSGLTTMLHLKPLTSKIAISSVSYTMILSGSRMMLAPTIMTRGMRSSCLTTTTTTLVMTMVRPWLCSQRSTMVSPLTPLSPHSLMGTTQVQG